MCIRDSYIWCDNKKYSALNIDVEDNIRLLNAQTVDNSVLRNSMLPSLMVFASENKGYSPTYGMFEIGRVFKGKRPDGTANERKTLGVLLLSHEKSERELFFTLRNMIATIAFNIKHSEFEFENIAPEHNWQHPKNTASVSLGGTKMGTLCTLHPTTLSAIDKKAAVVCAEIDLDLFCSEAKQAVTYCEPSKYPAIEADLTFVVPDGVCFSQLSKAWTGNNPEFLENVSLVDVYEDGDVTNVSIRLRFVSNERTLARTEIQPCIDSIIDTLAKTGINLKQ